MNSDFHACSLQEPQVRGILQIVGRVYFPSMVTCTSGAAHHSSFAPCRLSQPVWTICSRLTSSDLWVRAQQQQVLLKVQDGH